VTVVARLCYKLFITATLYSPLFSSVASPHAQHLIVSALSSSSSIGLCFVIVTERFAIWAHSWCGDSFIFSGTRTRLQQIYHIIFLKHNTPIMQSNNYLFKCILNQSFITIINNIYIYIFTLRKKYE